MNDYTINTEDSTVNWKADRILSAGHYGTVKIKEGTARYENSVLKSGRVVIDMESIESDSGEKLEGHLKSEDFFMVEEYPEAIIEITSTELVANPNGDVTIATADLTIKGITNEITFPVTHDEYWTTASFKIDRTDWDIKYGSDKFFDDLKDKAIKDEIEFEVNLSYE